MEKRYDRRWWVAFELALAVALGVMVGLLIGGFWSVGRSGASHALGVARVVTIAPARAAEADSGSACGVERAAVKHLTDGFRVPAQAKVMTVDQLVGMAAPPVTRDSPRFPVERTLVELVGVHVVAAKQEADSDLHVIVATRTGAEMNVEAPMAACDASSPDAAMLAAARAAIDRAMPNVSSQAYTPEDLTVTIEGMLFFDVLHGQRGAPNGVELHPVTYFAVGSLPAPQPGPQPTSGATTSAPTTSVLPGCVRWPGRIYFHHRRQRHCAPGFFTTP